MKRSREGEMFHVKQEEGGVPVFGGGLPSLPPAALAFSLLFLPPSPRPPSPVGKGEIFGLFCRGLAPPAPLRLSPGGTGYFLPYQCFLPPSPRPPSQREGGDFWFSYARGFAPCIPGAEPGRHWLFLSCQCFLPPSPLPPPSRREGGDFLFYFAGGWRPRHPCY